MREQFYFFIFSDAQNIKLTQHNRDTFHSFMTAF